MAKKKQKASKKEESIPVNTPQKAKEDFLAELQTKVNEWIQGEFVEDTLHSEAPNVDQDRIAAVRQILQEEYTVEMLEQLAEAAVVRALDNSGRDELSINDMQTVLMANLSDNEIKEQMTMRIKDILKKIGSMLEKPKDKTAAEYLEMAQRIQADFDNYRKRTLRDMDNNRKLATVSLIQKLLPVLDALDQAMANEKNPEQDKSGMQQIMKLFSNVLTKEGLEEIEAAGTIFNPEFHEAISQEEVEELSEETVLEVFRRGYRIGDRVIRASMVKVGVPTAEPVIEPTEEIVEVNSPESEEE